MSSREGRTSSSPAPVVGPTSLTTSSLSEVLDQAWSQSGTTLVPQASQPIRAMPVSVAQSPVGTPSMWPLAGNAIDLTGTNGTPGTVYGTVPVPVHTSAAPVRLEPLKTKYGGEAGAALDEWVLQTGLLMDLFEPRPSDARAVAWLATGLSGSALAWFVHRKSSTGPPIVSAAQLYTELRKRFQPIDMEETARQELHVLRQGKSSVDEYTQKFNRLSAAIPGLDFRSLMFSYRTGLNTGLQDKIESTYPQPATFEELVTLAARLDGRARRAHADHAANIEAQGSGNSGGALYTQEQLNAILAAHVTNSGRGAPSQQQQAPAYDSRVNRGANKRGNKEPWLQIPGMTKELWERRSQANQCRWCGSGEHRMYDCQERTSKKAPRLN